MTTDTIARPQTLEELIQLGRSHLAQVLEVKTRIEQNERLAEQKAAEVQLTLVLEQLPEPVHPFVEIREPSRTYGQLSVGIQLPNCDLILSDWSFDIAKGTAIRKNAFQVHTFHSPSWESFPVSQDRHYFGELEMALAFAVDQGPTYAMAEAAIAARAEREQLKMREPDLKDRLQTALELGDKSSQGTDASWRLNAVIAEALVQIAESQRAFASLQQYQFGG